MAVQLSVRLNLNRLLEDLKAAQINDPAKAGEDNFVLCFNDHRAVLIRMDKRTRDVLHQNVKHTATPPARREEDDDREDKVSWGD
jgi:hypothetical protein